MINNEYIICESATNCSVDEFCGFGHFITSTSLLE